VNKILVKYHDPETDCFITEEFESVVGSQIGTGIVQVVTSNGVQRVINNFITVDIIPDEKTQKKSLEMADKAYAEKEEKPEAANEGSVPAKVSSIGGKKEGASKS